MPERLAGLAEGTEGCTVSSGMASSPPGVGRNANGTNSRLATRPPNIPFCGTHRIHNARCALIRGNKNSEAVVHLHRQHLVLFGGLGSVGPVVRLRPGISQWIRDTGATHTVGNAVMGFKHRDHVLPVCMRDLVVEGHGQAKVQLRSNVQRCVTPLQKTWREKRAETPQHVPDDSTGLTLF